MEIWRPIPSAPNYEASSAGRIRRSARGKKTRVGLVLNPKVERNGYLRVSLCHNATKAMVSVHRLVCEAFHGPPTNAVCAHRDGVKTNNAPENLRWTTHVINNGADKLRLAKMAHGIKSGKSKLTEADIPKIRAAVREGTSLSETGNRFQVTAQNIYSIIHRKTWKHIS